MSLQVEETRMARSTFDAAFYTYIGACKNKAVRPAAVRVLSDPEWSPRFFHTFEHLMLLRYCEDPDTAAALVASIVGDTADYQSIDELEDGAVYVEMTRFLTELSMDALRTYVATGHSQLALIRMEQVEGGSTEETERLKQKANDGRDALVRGIAMLNVVLAHSSKKLAAKIDAFVG